MCLMLSQVLGRQQAKSYIVSNLMSLWPKVRIPTSRNTGLPPLDVLRLASYETFGWVGHVEGPSERSSSKYALGAQGSQGEVTQGRGRASRRDPEPSSLPSARFLPLFLPYFIVWRLLLWWKKLDGLSP